MDNELTYGDPESDPITNQNARDKINSSEEASVSQIYSNAISITSEPLIPAGDVKFESEIAPVADIDGAADGSILSGFSEIAATICINGTPTTGTILFKAS